MIHELAGRPPLAPRLNLIWVLTCRNFHPRNRQDRGRFLWVFLEPVGAIVIMTVMFTLLGRNTPYGPSLMLFMTTGFAIHYTFVKIVHLVASAIMTLHSAGRLAPIGLFDEALARSFFKILVLISYLSVLYFVIEYIDHIDIKIYSIYYILEAIAGVYLLSLGVGLIIGVLSTIAPTVGKLYNIATRIMVFLSGVFFVPSFLPPVVRDWIAWNPVLQAIETMRFGVFPGYPSLIYEPTILWGAAFIAATLGTALAWRRRSKLFG